MPKYITAYEKTYDGIYVRHIFKGEQDQGGVYRWLLERAGLSVTVEGGRGFLHPAQEEKLPPNIPTVWHVCQ